MQSRSATFGSRGAGLQAQRSAARLPRPLLPPLLPVPGGGAAADGSRSNNPASRRRGNVAALAVKLKTGRQVACSKTLVAKPEHADKVAEMLQAVVREHYGPLSAPPARPRPVSAVPPPPAAAAASSASSAETATIAAAPAAPPVAPLVDPDLPRLLCFSAERDAWDRNVFHLWMQAGSNEALGRIDTAPRALAFMRDAAPFLERPVGMMMYSMGPDGSLGAPAVQGGPKGEGGLDDATGASGMVGGAGGGQTSAALAAMVAQAMNEEGAEHAAGAGAGGGGSGGGASGGAAKQGPPLAALAGGAVAVAVAAAAAWLWLGGGGGGAAP